MKQIKFLMLTILFITAMIACKKENNPVEKAFVAPSAAAPPATNYGRAWAWYNGSGAPASYQFCSSGSTAAVRRITTGSYQVIFPGMGYLYNGVVHAIAYGGNHTAQVESWSSSGADLVANIKCFAPCGSLADGKFVAFFYKEGSAPSYNSGYMWSNSSSYHFNSKGMRNTLTKIGTGIYRVSFPGLRANFYRPGELGNIIVTPYGSQPRRCQVGGWNHDASGLTSTIYTYDGCGNPADAQFSISYISDFRIGQAGYSEDTDYGAYVWYDLNTVPHLSYQARNAGGRDAHITVARIGTGYYEVTLPFALRNSTSTTVIASSYGIDKSYVSIQSWNVNPVSNITKVYIKCFAPNGTPMASPSKFTLFFYSNENILY